MYPKFWLEFNKLSDSFYFQKDLLRKKTSSIGQALIQDLDNIQLLNKQSICNHEFVEINNKKVYKRKMVECIKCNLFITKSKANDMKSILKSKNKNS